MAQANPRLKLLLIEDDELLILDTKSLAHPDVEFCVVTPGYAAASRAEFNGYDAIIICINAPVANEALPDLCRRNPTVPVIALGSSGLNGHSLEHTLTLAELRGAALALPKPIDALELALATVDLLERRAGEIKPPKELAKDLERRLAY
ncbi:MAG TPA: hypothetical protein VG942_14735 [Hyphomonadaceae bacterium]|nr:hypothetical protein [Hyphomonadaceae bacterium]